MTREQGRRRAAVLLILAVVLWFHAWFPALLVVAFVVWVLLHKRLEGDLGRALLPLWRHVWPPAPLVLVALLVAATMAYWVSGPAGVEKGHAAHAHPVRAVDDRVWALVEARPARQAARLSPYRKSRLRAEHEAARSPIG
jgi:hypothetical protein